MKKSVIIAIRKYREVRLLACGCTAREWQGLESHPCRLAPESM